MSILDNIMDFNSQSISQLCVTLVKWYGFEYCIMEIKQRPDVESGVWINIEFEKNGKKGIVSAQRLGLAKERLIAAIKPYTSPKEEEKP